MYVPVDHGLAVTTLLRRRRVGPVPFRPYSPLWVPWNWRGWMHFGSGVIGDWICHVLDPAFWALDLKHPTKISAEGAPRSEELCADWIIARYDFPARGEQQHRDS